MISPCVRLCVLDPADNVCEGCGRTADEIAHWIQFSDTERRAIMAALPARLALRHAETPSDRHPADHTS